MPHAPLFPNAVRSALGTYHRHKHRLPKRDNPLACSAKRNVEFTADITDLIADLLILAEGQGVDPATLMSAAACHIPSLADVHYAIGRVFTSRALSAESKADA